MKIEKKLRDIKSIRLLFVFDLVIIAILLIALLNPKASLAIMIIFFPLLIICISLQLALYFIPKGSIVFDSSGVTIFTKTKSINVDWNNVEHIYYNSFSRLIPFLDHFTIDLRLNNKNEIIDLDQKYGNIKVYEKEYMQIVSLIPHQLLKKNMFMIYRNIMEKNENKYNQ